jgi:hypothetical protein
MTIETIEIDGYTANIDQQTDHASNPWEDGDCEPPLLAFNDSLTSYGAPSIGDLVAMIPESHFARHNRVELIREFLPDLSLKEFVENLRYYGGDVRERFAEELQKEFGEPNRRSGWTYASEYFDLLESLAKLAGVPCFLGQSNGYCQGDSALVLVFATPDWADLVGAPEETHEEQCKNAFDLYGAYLWGDVYGVSSITDPDGEDIEDGSCWDFYGGDHEKSGLLDYARSTVRTDQVLAERARVAQQAYEEKESKERAFWEARDLVTA